MLSVSCGMIVPALYAAKIADFGTMQNFLFSAALVAALAFILGLAMMNRSPRNTARSYLVTVMLVYIVMPVFMALPFAASVPDFGLGRAYFEMLSSFTTTGATLVDDPLSIAPALHLWRALVSWLGGLFILVVAYSIMEPLNIGGFEIRSTVAGEGPGTNSSGNTDAPEKIIRSTLTIGPVYLIATFLLMLLLIISGDRALVAAIHAMSILSTSGISSVGGLEGGTSGRMGEVFMAVFLLFAISHKTFQSFNGSRNFKWIKKDAEVRIMLIAITVVPLILFMRHWAGSFVYDGQADFMFAMRTLWAGLFTLLSFLTTTGFTSADWHEAGLWSGLGSSGVVLLAAAVAGGGVATTAGGVKLLRIYALYKHGARELERLINPSSIGGSGTAARRFRREGGIIAWIFLMLFSIAIAGVMLALSLDHVPFQDTIGLAIATLSNTGPAAILFDPNLRFSGLNSVALAILSAAMIIGRVEVLVLIALFNPSYWRR